ncbi:hypothetical protein ACI3E1_06730 [Ligilactobacillus sp. LYQ139]|uniref:hypothetical protein n=1 Tax=Ligilactobacillus sp. LYQ139 TaxID=3378800 RepID=UPI0038523AED
MNHFSKIARIASATLLLLGTMTMASGAIQAQTVSSSSQPANVSSSRGGGYSPVLTNSAR